MRCNMKRRLIAAVIAGMFSGCVTTPKLPVDYFAEVRMRLGEYWAGRTPDLLQKEMIGCITPITLGIDPFKDPFMTRCNWFKREDVVTCQNFLEEKKTTVPEDVMQR